MMPDDLREWVIEQHLKYFYASREELEKESDEDLAFGFLAYWKTEMGDLKG